MGLQSPDGRITDQANRVYAANPQPLMKQAQAEYPVQQTLPWGWIGFFSIIILLALISSFALLSVGKQLAGQEIPEQSVLRIIIDGKTYHVPEQAQAELASETNHIIKKQQLRVTHQIEQHIEQLLNGAFAPVHERIPDFADWYYSLTAEYMRYAHAIGGDIAGYLQDQLLQRVFQAARVEQVIDDLPTSINNYLKPLLGENGQTIIQQLQAVTAAHSIQDQSGITGISSQLNLDLLIDIEPDLNEQIIDRHLISVLAATGMGVGVGKGLGALMVKKTLTKITAGKSFQAASGLLAKLAAKSAMKGGGSLGAAATGMVLCSPTGPGALLCGVVAGIAAWVAVDAAIINLDEMLNRETFEADMHHVISEQQRKLSRAYSEAYSALLVGHFSKLHQAGNHLLNPPATFVPAETMTR
jgi:hypothetical protein